MDDGISILEEGIAARPASNVASAILSELGGTNGFASFIVRQLKRIDGLEGKQRNERILFEWTRYAGGWVKSQERIDAGLEGYQPTDAEVKALLMGRLMEELNVNPDFLKNALLMVKATQPEFFSRVLSEISHTDVLEASFLKGDEDD